MSSVPDAPPPWRVAFAGTPEFAAVALAAIGAAGHAVPLVLTQPDRPAGRGLQLHPSPVKRWASAQGVPVVQPRSLRLDGKYPDDAQAARTALAAAAPDIMVVAAYGLILPAWVLALPRHGCLNIHASLLPRWRGAAPIHRAVEAGDACTGITIMQMDEGLDTGPMCLLADEPIGPGDTTASLHDRLAALGGRLVVDALAAAARGALPKQPQPAAGATYAAKIDKHEALLRWSEPAAQLERRVRAFDPAPGCSFVLEGQPVKLWRAHVTAGPAPADAVPGQVVGADGHRILVACGQGLLGLDELQRPGGRRVPVAAFQSSRPISAGQMLG